ncbi:MULTISPECIES: hypothetical protein [unclassified Limnobacter]|uniref:hypothetical protein n=1 Tax=unclassified Limnobacter TaxID=2630203 RepID=UPI000C5A5F7E|nr:MULTISPECIES: hypothetical protein [unclassified Limnobacter]MAZ09298.1 hypothetical protein [Sutterellaceae bacterium]|tara:strand:- start:415 stop:1110 length:696 start_codon:yes stop_codon:yes gene_type:complete
MCQDLNNLLSAGTYDHSDIERLDPDGVCELDGSSPLRHGPLADEEFIVRSLDFPQHYLGPDLEYKFSHLNFSQQAFPRGKGASSQRYMSWDSSHSKKICSLLIQREIPENVNGAKPRKVIGYCKQSVGFLRSLNHPEPINNKQVRIYNSSNEKEDGEFHCDIFVFLKYDSSINKARKKEIAVEVKLNLMNAFVLQGDVFLFSHIPGYQTIRDNFPVVHKVEDCLNDSVIVN